MLCRFWLLNKNNLSVCSLNFPLLKQRKEERQYTLGGRGAYSNKSLIFVTCQKFLPTTMYVFFSCDEKRTQLSFVIYNLTLKYSGLYYCSNLVASEEHHAFCIIKLTIGAENCTHI